VVLSEARWAISARIGAGYGAATGHLLKLAPQVTSLEYDPRCCANWTENKVRRIDVDLWRCGDVPFADQSFSSAVCHPCFAPFEEP